MPVHGGEVHGVNLRDFRPAADWILKVAPQHDSMLWYIEVAMNQMDAQSLVGVVADK